MAKTITRKSRQVEEGVVGAASASQGPTTVAELRRLIRWSIRAHTRVLITGEPGVGKTAVIGSMLGNEFSGELSTVIGALSEPTDLLGFPLEGPPVTDAAGRQLPSIQFAPRDHLIRLNREGGILFLDELTCSSPAVLAVGLRLLNDGVAGDYQLDLSKVGILAAANPADIAVNGIDLPGPSANRLIHLKFPVGPEARAEWCSNFPGYWGKPPKIDFQGDVLQESVFMRARSVIAGFLTVRPHLWLKYPTDSPSAQSGPWPSPRSWTGVARILAVAFQDGARPSEALDLIIGAVGSGAAYELLSAMTLSDLPDPEQILAEFETYTPSGRADVDGAALYATVEAVRAKFTGERVIRCAHILATRTVKHGNTFESAAPAAMLLYKLFNERWKDTPPTIAPEVFKEFRITMAPFQAIAGKMAQG